MTLPASGQIDILQILAEFGAPAGTPLTSMVRGGAYVPNNAQNVNVPTAPPISCTDFYGAANYTPVSGSASPSPVDEQVFLNEPAPGSQTVFGNTTITPAGGNGGPYTYAWSYLSGDASISFTPGGSPTGKTCQFSATVLKGGTKTATFRCVVSDGISSFNVDVSVSLSYFTDL